MENSKGLISIFTLINNTQLKYKPFCFPSNCFFYQLVEVLNKYIVELSREHFQVLILVFLKKGGILKKPTRNFYWRVAVQVQPYNSGKRVQNSSFSICILADEGAYISVRRNLLWLSSCIVVPSITFHNSWGRLGIVHFLLQSLQYLGRIQSIDMSEAQRFFVFNNFILKKIKPPDFRRSLGNLGV